MAQHDSSPPAAAYRFTVHASIEGATGPLRIEASSINDLRRAVRSLAAAGMIADPPAAAAVAQPTGPARCPHHGRELKPSQRPGTLFCPAKNDDGSYCRHRVAG